MSRDHIHGRLLTAREQAWRDDHRCIWCGAKVEPRRLRRESDGRWEWTWPYSCDACQRTQRQGIGADLDASGKDWGAMRATAAAQAPVILGYHPPRDGGGAEMLDDGDD